MKNLFSRYRKRRQKKFLLRVSQPEIVDLHRLVFKRYPDSEWGTFARFGWRDTGDSIIVTLTALDPPEDDDLDHTVPNVSFNEPYTLRIALMAEQHALAVGVIHSHPQDAPPVPSSIDDDMDGYFARYFSDFAPDRPYVSLILSTVSGRLMISGRVFWRNQWIMLERAFTHANYVKAWPIRNDRLPHAVLDRAARFASAFGAEAYRALRGSTAGVVGAGGTGSAAIETLARAGVGRLVIVDPDTIESSNLERVRGSTPRHVSARTPKVIVARDLVHQIDRSVEVVALQARLPQKKVVDALVTADVVLGCTDQQHSRLALSDLAFRYLIPAIDCGVLLEGKDGRVTGQIAQFVRFLPADPCVLCREMINPRRVAQELMSPKDRSRRRAAAAAAQERGDVPDPYWLQERQINTVGYLTSTVGAMLAGYAIGWLTGRFDPPFERLQMNLVAPFLDVTDLNQPQRLRCPCARFRGWADQGRADALISAPAHWPAAVSR